MAMPKYFQNDDSIKVKANRREAKVFKHLVSGALSWKGDFSESNAVIDNKSTDKQSISISEKMLAKIIEDAITMGKEHAVIVIDLPGYYVTGKIVRKSGNEKV